jgi:hypothetical protein
MSRISMPDPPTSSWQSLRKRADLLGIPAWKLAEDYSVHLSPEEVQVKSDQVNS